MKNIFDKILFFLIFFIIGLFSISFFFIEKKEFSNEENRFLASFSLSELNEYLSDHFPMRTQLIKLKNKTEKLSGKNLINGIYLAKDNYLIPEFADNNKKHYLIETINDYALLHDVDVMIVPDSVLINKDKINTIVTLDEEKEINDFYMQLKYSNNINLIDRFYEENKIDDLYYRTDHHWTSYGAMVAYQEYLKNKNMPYLEKKDFDIQKVTDDFLGTSSTLALGYGQKESIYVYNRNLNVEVNYVYENKKTNMLYNYDYLKVKDKYAMFLDNNHALIQIENKDINDGSNILVIKNSYANAFVPFLVNHFETVHVIDMRYFSKKVSDYAMENNIQNTLILYNLNNMYADMSLVKLK